jgi:hypothetical protein
MNASDFNSLSTIEARLRRAQIQRILMLWFTVLLFILIGILFTTFRSNMIAGCHRGSETAAIQADLARRVGALAAARQASERARLDCNAAYSWF